MTTCTLNESIEMLDKLSVVFENAMDRLDYYQVLIEAVDGEENKDSVLKKAGTALDAAYKAWLKFLDWAIDIFKNLYDTIMYKIRGGERAIAKEDIRVSQYTFDDNVIYKLKNASKTDLADMDIQSQESQRNVLYKKAGSKVDLKKVITRIQALRQFSREVRRAKYDPEDKIRKQATMFIIKAAIKDLKSILSKCEGLSKKDEAKQKQDAEYEEYMKRRDAENAAAKYGEPEPESSEPTKRRGPVTNPNKPGRHQTKQDALKSKKFGTQHNSVDDSALSKNEFIASLMLEAAELLKEDAGTDDVVRDDTDFQEFEDIPEEKPVIQDEYDPDVNGGEGEEIDLEEIEDLCDGDQDVIDLLIDDEDKSVTVDASNESALDYFNLDW